jgi:hypothetical protein
VFSCKMYYHLFQMCGIMIQCCVVIAAFGLLNHQFNAHMREDV